MPAKIKYEWSTLLDIVRHLWRELGRAPTPNAVSEAAGGGAPNRIADAITAVGIEHGLHLSLYDKLPKDLQALIKPPKDGADALPEVDCSPALATVVREVMAQIATACATAERIARRDAAQLVEEAETRTATELAAMHDRLHAGATDAETAARMYADEVARYERRLGIMSSELASARTEASGLRRELDHVNAEVQRARQTESETCRRWEQGLEQQQAESAAHATNLAAVTERALRAEAERDAERKLGERLTGELDALRRTMDEASAQSESELAGLRAELAASKQSHQDAERLRAVAEAVLAESRAGRAERFAAPSSPERGDTPRIDEVSHAPLA